jgi:hypothetical protein
MIIPVTLKSPSGEGSKLPSQLADLGNGDFVLIELQGSLEVHVKDPKDSLFVGTLEIDPKTVRVLFVVVVKPGRLTRVHPVF